VASNSTSGIFKLNNIYKFVCDHSKILCQFSAGTTKKLSQAQRQIIFRSGAENWAMIFDGRDFFFWVSFSFS